MFCKTQILSECCKNRILPEVCKTQILSEFCKTQTQFGRKKNHHKQTRGARRVCGAWVTVPCHHKLAELIVGVLQNSDLVGVLQNSDFVGVLQNSDFLGVLQKSDFVGVLQNPDFVGVLQNRQDPQLSFGHRSVG